MGQGGDVCSAINCSNSKKRRPELSFFRFPKDPERCKKWLINSRREDLMNKDEVYLYNNIKFCALHFEKTQFMNENKNKLIWNAVPTLFDVPNKPALLSVKREIPSLEPAAKERNDSTSVSAYSLNSNYTFSNNSSDSLPGQGPSSEVSTEEKVLILNDTFSNDSSDSLPEQGPSSEVSRPTEEKVLKLNKLVKNLRKQVKYKSSEINRLRKRCKELKKCPCTCQCKRNSSTVVSDKEKLKCIGSKYLKPEALNVLLNQIRLPVTKKCGFRWDDEMKLFALNMLHCSPKGYRFLSQYFELPSVRILQKYVQGIRLHTAVNESMFTQILKE
ncbi:THAP domain-containing protein 2-like [Periplaneta americana]|uniref:THAP domain-containing protein 2-like n=1 Tax=Periplaneta americana TaxID=6978 RepID=UPI0037E7B902